MMTITSPRRTVECVEFQRSFTWRDDPGAGFGFPCHEDGTVLTLALSASVNYSQCLNGHFDVIDNGVQRLAWSYTEPAIGRCQCGAQVVLDGDATCVCGREYNQSGQELAPRHMWGEETGETFGTWTER